MESTTPSMSSATEIVSTQAIIENSTLLPIIKFEDNENHLLDLLMGQAKQSPAYRDNPSEFSINRPQVRPIAISNRQQSPGILQQLFGFVSGSGVSSPGNIVRPHPGQPPSRPFNSNEDEPTSFHGNRAVTENELYLLGAIEKLVYRVDYLESRVRRSEQLIYYLMEGNKQHQGK